MQVNGEDYIQIKGKKRGLNHWNLTARVENVPLQDLGDGQRIRITVLDDQGQPVPKASNLPAVTVDGTDADTFIEGLGPTTTPTINFQALIRLDLEPILAQVGSTVTTIDLPVEFVLLDVD